MADSPLPLQTDAPTDKRELEQWLEAEAVALDEVLTGEISRIVGLSLEQFLAGYLEGAEVVTASGDFSDFDNIVPRWQRAVARLVLPVVERLYVTGGVSASVTSPGFGTVPLNIASAWVAVVNSQAVAYASSRVPLLNNIGYELRTIISGKVAEAVRSGRATEKVARDIRDLTNSTEYKAHAIARTEINGAYNTGNFESLNAMPVEYQPREKYWIAALDDVTRPTHLAMDAQTARQTVPWNEPYRFPGGPMMHPHDPRGPAEEVVNCRCSQGELYAGMRRPDGTRVPG